MKKHVWGKIDPKIQGMIVADFKMAGIDFEKDFVQDCSGNEVESNIESPWFTRREASTYAKHSVYTIDNWIKTGDIKYSKTAEGRPGRILIDKYSLEKFIRNRTGKHKKHSRKMAPSIKGGYRVQHKKD